MQIAKLTDNLSVAPQVTERDLEEAAALGFKTVINNRPDGESPDQPRGTDLAAAAKRLGLEYRHIPVIGGQLNEAQIKAFGDALAAMPGPVLAFCRTGTRSTTLWALSSAQSLAPDAILTTAAGAGYNLQHLLPALQASYRG